MQCALNLNNDEKVLIFGEDVGENGGVFRATEGLQAEFGEDRVFDTPLAESGIGGLAIGLATQGFRPVPEIQFFGFVYEVMDSVAGQMARYAFPFWWKFDMPNYCSFTIRWWCSYTRNARGQFRRIDGSNTRS